MSFLFVQQMNLAAVLSLLLVVSTVQAFQYTELTQFIDSHQEEYVEVQYHSPSLSNT